MMGQARWIVAILLAAALAATAAAGQGVEGPLGEPGASTGAPAKTVHKSRRHGDKGVRSEGAKPGVAKLPDRPVEPARDHRAASLPEAVPTATAPSPQARRAAAPAADDPISLGYKWQGSNDTAEKTRVQNYGGDAAGTGAAVGLKLHF